MEHSSGYIKLGYKTSLNKFRKNEIIPRIFSNHKGITLETNKGKDWKISQRCGNYHISNQRVKKKLKEKFQKISKQMKMEKIYPNFWNAAKAVLRRKFMAINTYCKKTKQTKKNNLRHLTLHFKQLKKE